MADKSAYHATSRSKLRVFVHLAENKDADRWRARWKDGTLVGVNDETPYGYGRARAFGCAVSFSKSHRETAFEKFFRYGARFLLGFDFVHAWRQRKALGEADIVWTHTESQYLAVAAVAKLKGLETKILGQTVWLFDHWGKLSLPKRWLYKSLIKRVDVLIFSSTANMEVARALFPSSDVRFVPFGIPTEGKLSPQDDRSKPFHILAIGNDRHRDWKTLVDVVKQNPDLSLTILSGSVPKQLAAECPNIEVRLARSNRELKEAFEAASVACVPLLANLHVSGITAIEEAVLAGVPVIATDTGGLRNYFTDREIRYVPTHNPSALLQALVDFRERPQDAIKMAIRAQDRMERIGLSAEDYISNHVRISLEILHRVNEQQKAAVAEMPMLKSTAPQPREP